MPKRNPPREPPDGSWLREELRTNLWVVPGLFVIASVLLFAVTYAYDQHVYNEAAPVPRWLNLGGADAARQVLIALAAAVITVVGVVFSVTIVALTLASSQFGPRMLRNFIRDRGTQVTLGCFVGTFVYAILALGSIGPESHGDFVPHLTIAMALVLVLGDLLVLIYFIHHVAMSIQLPRVIAGIASDLRGAVDTQLPRVEDSGDDLPDEAVADAMGRLADHGLSGAITAGSSGYLQFVSRRRLLRILEEHDAVVELLYRPGHFVSAGRALARVWPATAAGPVGEALQRAHVTGSQRTLSQDLAFAVDQLVEIAIRALSPAVNDTFTALSCIDWLGDGLALVTERWVADRRVWRDEAGRVRLIEAANSYDQLADRAYDKIRQAGRGNPAVMIRQLDSLGRVLEVAQRPEHREVLTAQADKILRSIDAIHDPADRADVERAYERMQSSALVMR